MRNGKKVKTEMTTVETVTEDTDLKKIGLELMFLTPEKCSREKGISAVELSKLLSIPTETVIQKMDEDDEVYQLLCSFDDVDFSHFFEY